MSKVHIIYICAKDVVFLFKKKKIDLERKHDREEKRERERES